MILANSSMRILGWDIGGVHVKLAVLSNGDVVTVRTVPFELQRAPARLAPLLRDMAAAAASHGLPDGSRAGAVEHAVTMTAELSQYFRAKDEGVRFVLDAVEQAFPDDRVHVFTVDGVFLTPSGARDAAYAVAAANWAATARIVAWEHSDAFLIDIGTTTTDIVPVVSGRVAACGRTDPERLASGALVYSGAVRTPVEAVVQAVPWAGGLAGVSAEGFALMGDVYLWRGELPAAAYTAPTPDGRPVTREAAGERLARVVCADRVLADEAAVAAIADAAAEAQQARIASAVARLRTAWPELRHAVVAGVGRFIAERVARGEGLTVVESARLQEPAGAVSVAWLLARQTEGA
jgi:(4-(4-[2-(gamma-L-glutamylamino)ethyl]phenoxymethyl)furan-2-yl)methanamine synthase